MCGLRSRHRLPRGLRYGLAGRFGPHNGMVRRGFLEVVEFEEGGSDETTRAGYRIR